MFFFSFAILSLFCSSLCFASSPIPISELLLDNNEVFLIPTTQKDIFDKACASKNEELMLSALKESLCDQVADYRIISFYFETIEFPLLTKYLLERFPIRNFMQSDTIFLACQNENITDVKIFIQILGVDPNFTDELGFSLLHHTVKGNNQGITKLLLDLDANPSGVCRKGNTPLHLACSFNYVDIAEILINGGCDVNIQNNEGKTALHLGAEGNNEKMVKVLLSVSGLMIDLKDVSGNSPLHSCIILSNIFMGYLLVDGGCDMDSLNIFGETPLQLCISSHRLEFAEKLIDSGCDLYTKNGLGQSPLYFAALFGDISFVKLLISKGFNVNGEEREGLKALAVATQYSHDDIADAISREIRTDSAAGGCSIQ